MLNDYIHFVEHHADPKSIEYIRNRLHFDCHSVAKCGATTRHHRERRDDEHRESKDEASNWFIDRVDSIHFMVYHLTEVGLRVSKEETMGNEAKRDDEEEDEKEFVDLALKRMDEVITAKRKAFSPQRLSGGKDSKFKLQIKGQDAENGGIC